MDDSVNSLKNTRYLISTVNPPTRVTFDSPFWQSTKVTISNVDTFIVTEFFCPKCGKLCMHKSQEGFIPNCENCGSVLRRSE